MDVCNNSHWGARNVTRQTNPPPTPPRTSHQVRLLFDHAMGGARSRLMLFVLTAPSHSPTYPAPPRYRRLVFTHRCVDASSAIIPHPLPLHRQHNPVDEAFTTLLDRLLAMQAGGFPGGPLGRDYQPTAEEVAVLASCKQHATT